MKSIDKVLYAVNIECERQTKFAEISCFDKIADRAEIPRQRLCLYLSELQEMGYIKYSMTDNFIYMTQAGKRFIS